MILCIELLLQIFTTALKVLIRVLLLDYSIFFIPEKVFGKACTRFIKIFHISLPCYSQLGLPIKVWETC